jgi:hypothetical protein
MVGSVWQVTYYLPAMGRSAVDFTRRVILWSIKTRVSQTKLLGFTLSMPIAQNNGKPRE